MRGRLGVWAPSTCGRRQLRTLHVSSLHARGGAERKTFSFRSFIHYKAYRGPKAALHPGPTSEGDPTATPRLREARGATIARDEDTKSLPFVSPSSLLAWLPLSKRYREIRIDQSRHTHEDLSDMMALVEAARTVLAATARSFAHIQMGSQRGWRSRLWPTLRVDAESVTGVEIAW